MKISMGNKYIGDSEPVYIVFEAGPTHTGLNSAMELAKNAKDAGADAIKFQITDHNNLIYNKDLSFHTRF